MAFNHSDVPRYPLGAGMGLGHGLTIPGGGEIKAYVRATTIDGLHPDIEARRFTTLNAALAECRSGAGDVVGVLPGHTENVSSADQMSNLVAGTQIVGMGYNAQRPTFTWSAATSTFLLDVNDVGLHNMILNLDPGTGTVTVAAPITVSGAGCRISGCLIRTSTDANSKTTIPITTTAAGDDFTIDGCYIYGATAGECTTGIQLVGADRFRMVDTQIHLATSSTTVGSVRFLTTASTNVTIKRCVIGNYKAASTVALTDMAAATGFIDDTHFIVNSGIAPMGTPAGSFRFGGGCTVDDAVNLRGAAFPGIAAT